MVTFFPPLLKLPSLLRKPAPAPPRDRDGRFRAGVEQAPLGIAFVDRDGGWLHVNDRFGEIVGYTREQLRRVGFHEITHPDDARREAALMRRLRAGEIRRYRIEKRVVDRRGHAREIVVAATLVREASEFFVFVVDEASVPIEKAAMPSSAQERAFAEQARAELRRTVDELRAELARRDAMLEEKAKELRIMARALRKEIERRKAAEGELTSIAVGEELAHVADELEAMIEIPPPPPRRPRGTELLVASPVARRFHQLHCGAARRLDEETRIMFTSAADAVDAGYAACRLCSVC